MIQSEYPSVLLIYTGGTIGMIENPETGALEAFNLTKLQDQIPNSEAGQRSSHLLFINY